MRYFYCDRTTRRWPTKAKEETCDEAHPHLLDFNPNFQCLRIN